MALASIPDVSRLPPDRLLLDRNRRTYANTEFLAVWCCFYLAHHVPPLWIITIIIIVLDYHVAALNMLCICLTLKGPTLKDYI